MLQVLLLNTLLKSLSSFSSESSSIIFYISFAQPLLRPGHNLHANISESHQTLMMDLLLEKGLIKDRYDFDCHLLEIVLLIFPLTSACFSSLFSVLVLYPRSLISHLCLP
jgi:hypothetical protein